MACYSPIGAYRLESGRVTFVERGSIHFHFNLPCGNCIGCRLDKASEWALRCVHEAKMHEKNVFITLTYDEDNLPQHGGLVYEHFQSFMRRVRYAKGPTRFYMAGEYGEQFKRPHFHACLFGIDFDDKKYLKTTGSGEKIYTSKELEELWPYGLSSLGEVTFESAAYVARYIVKKLSADEAEHRRTYMRVDAITGEIYEVAPEFVQMSLKPGIGATWFKKWMTDVFPHDRVIINGQVRKPPKYYKQLLKKLDPMTCDEIDYDRYKKGLTTLADNTEARLATREIVARARLNFKKRVLD